MVLIGFNKSFLSFCTSVLKFIIKNGWLSGWPKNCINYFVHDNLLCHRDNLMGQTVHKFLVTKSRRNMVVKTRTLLDLTSNEKENCGKIKIFFFGLILKNIWENFSKNIRPGISERNQRVHEYWIQQQQCSQQLLKKQVTNQCEILN